MAKANPVEYAEETLGVHAVYEEAVERLAKHEAAKTAYLTSLGGIRYAEQQIESREAEIVSEQRGEHPDMGIQEFKLHVKTVGAGDDRMQELSSALTEEKANRDESEQDMRHHELGVRALTARMQELGGLLDFYAAAKSGGGRTT